MPHERWVITFEPRPDPAPVAARMKKLLKYAGRALGLKAIRVSGPPAEEIPTPDAAQGEGEPS
jgi:hypothetical protein